MLFFDTVMRLYEELGNPQISWADIDGKVKRVKWGDYFYSLEDAFYSSHMGGYDPNREGSKILEAEFKKALMEIM